MCGFHLGDFVGEAKREKRWSNHIWICEGGFPSKKVGQPIFCQIEKVFIFGEKWRVRWRENVAIDQLERRNLKNAHFWKWGLLACIICFGFMFDFYCSHLMCMNHALPFHFIVWPSTAWVPHILAFPSTLHIHLWIYMFDIPCIETRIILAFAFYIFL